MNTFLVQFFGPFAFDCDNLPCTMAIFKCLYDEVGFVEGDGVQAIHACMGELQTANFVNCLDIFVRRCRCRDYSLLINARALSRCPSLINAFVGPEHNVRAIYVRM